MNRTVLNQGQMTELQAIRGELERIRARLRWLASEVRKRRPGETDTDLFIFEAAANITPAISKIADAILEGSAEVPND